MWQRGRFNRSEIKPTQLESRTEIEEPMSVGSHEPSIMLLTPLIVLSLHQATIAERVPVPVVKLEHSYEATIQ
jgi:hypothetical protein